MSKSVSVLNSGSLGVTFNVFDSAYELARLIKNHSGAFVHSGSIDDLIASTADSIQRGTVPAVCSTLLTTMGSLHAARHRPSAAFNSAYRNAQRAVLVLSVVTCGKWKPFTDWVRSHKSPLKTPVVPVRGLSIISQQATGNEVELQPRQLMWRQPMSKAATQAMVELTHFLNLIDVDTLPFIVPRDELGIMRQLIVFMHTVQVGDKVRHIPTSSEALAASLAPLPVSSEGDGHVHD